jgi:NADPH2:quinone reductase
VSSEEKAALARQAGADHVVNYREEGAAGRVRRIAPSGIDRIVEVSPAANLELDLEVAARNAAIASYATDRDPTVPVERLMQANLVLRFVLVYTMGQDAIGRAVTEVNAAVADGALTVLPLHRFPLEQIADAHDAVEQGAVGKVIVDLAP